MTPAVIDFPLLLYRTTYPIVITWDSSGRHHVGRYLIDVSRVLQCAWILQKVQPVVICKLQRIATAAVAVSYWMAIPQPGAWCSSRANDAVPDSSAVKSSFPRGVAAGLEHSVYRVYISSLHWRIVRTGDLLES